MGFGCLLKDAEDFLDNLLSITNRKLRPIRRRNTERTAWQEMIQYVTVPKYGVSLFEKTGHNGYTACGTKQ